MGHMKPTERQITTSYARLLPRVEAYFAREARDSPDEWYTFVQRLKANFPRLFRLYFQLFAGRYDFLYQLEAVFEIQCFSHYLLGPGFRD